MNEQNKLINITENDWRFPDEILSLLSDYEKSFINAEFGITRTLNDYLEKIDYLGLKGYNNILDAGCGMGQWSLALSKVNASVNGVDISSSRLLIAKELMRKNNISNVNLQFSSLESMPYADNTFDGIFCYSVIMFTDIPKTLKEFYRVLKPNGKIYIMTDLWPWYYYMKKNRSVYLSLLRMLMNTVLLKTNNRFYNKNWFLKQMTKAGFISIHSYDEGYGTFNENVKPNSNIIFYPQSNSKMQQLIEVLAFKP